MGAKLELEELDEVLEEDDEELELDSTS